MTEVIYTLQSEKNTIDGKIGSICIEDDFNSHLKKNFVHWYSKFVPIYFSYKLMHFFKIGRLKLVFGIKGFVIFGTTSLFIRHNFFPNS